MGGSVPDIPGVKANYDLAEGFREEVAQLLGRKQKSFPGAQPVSFSARHLLELRQRDYYVTEKSDGIRCLLYCARGDPENPEIHYLIDRKNDYYYVRNLHFPIAHDPSFQKFHAETIVDGELVMDRMKDGSEKMKYLVFDCLVLDGNSLRDRPLDKRLAYFREKMFLPYQAFVKQYSDYVATNFPFIVELKASQKSYGVEMMFRETIPQLQHGNDGLIFTCRDSGYRFGTDEHILKWKPPNENSVDFRLHLEFPLVELDSEDEEDGITTPYPDYNAMPKFNLLVSQNGGTHSLYGTMFVEGDEWEKLKARKEPLDERVVECYQDGEQRWRFLRFRDDKKDANHISTVESIIESIQDGISEADLLKNAKAIKDQWKKREAAETDRKRKMEIEHARRQAEAAAEEAKKASRSTTPSSVQGLKRGAVDTDGEVIRNSEKKQRVAEGSEMLTPDESTGGRENGAPAPEGNRIAGQAGTAVEKEDATSGDKSLWESDLAKKNTGQGGQQRNGHRNGHVDERPTLANHASKALSDGPG